jgi:hypothetical protein
VRKREREREGERGRGEENGGEVGGDRERVK